MTGRVKVKKLLSRQRQSNYSKKCFANFARNMCRLSYRDDQIRGCSRTNKTLRRWGNVCDEAQRWSAYYWKSKLTLNYLKPKHIRLVHRLEWESFTTWSVTWKDIYAFNQLHVAWTISRPCVSELLCFNTLSLLCFVKAHLKKLRRAFKNSSAAHLKEPRRAF